MDSDLKAILERQLGAAMSMLEQALNACPDELWSHPLWQDPVVGPKFSQFWYVAYHCLFWLDLYLSGAVEGFTPPAPFTLDELDPRGLLPERTYTPAELSAYLEHSRAKAHTILAGLTDAQASRICRFPWGEVSYLELLLDTMRHVQEHGAQLNLFLGQERGTVSRWKAKV
jgi:hypothetical protein